MNVHKIRSIEILLLYTWIALPHMLVIVYGNTAGISELSTVRENAIFPFQGILILTDINDIILMTPSRFMLQRP